MDPGQSRRDIVKACLFVNEINEVGKAVSCVSQTKEAAFFGLVPLHVPCMLQTAVRDLHGQQFAFLDTLTCSVIIFSSVPE